jgi:PEP-CTERM motif
MSRAVCVLLLLCASASAQFTTIDITAGEEGYADDLNHVVSYGGVSVGGWNVSGWAFQLPPNLPQVYSATLELPLGTNTDGTPDVVSFYGVDPLADNANGFSGGFYLGPDEEWWPGDRFFFYASATVTPGPDPTAIVTVPLGGHVTDDILSYDYGGGNFNLPKTGWFLLESQVQGTDIVLVSSQPAHLILTVPEPSTLLLSALGLLCLAISRCTRRAV